MEGMWSPVGGGCLPSAWLSLGSPSLGSGVFYSLSSSLAVGNQLSRWLVGVGTDFPRVPPTWGLGDSAV